jgi:hypothetical protein
MLDEQVIRKHGNGPANSIHFGYLISNVYSIIWRY